MNIILCIRESVAAARVAHLRRWAKMNDSAYEDLMREAATFMRSQNALAWSKWALADLPRFDWDQDSGEIVFSGPTRAAVVADIQFIGSWSERANTWMWAWANESLVVPMKKEVEEVRSFGRAKQLPELTDAIWEGPIEAAWDMTSLSCYILRSEMAYRAPDSEKLGFSFLSLRNLRAR